MKAAPDAVRERERETERERGEREREIEREQYSSKCPLQLRAVFITLGGDWELGDGCLRSSSAQLGKGFCETRQRTRLLPPPCTIATLWAQESNGVVGKSAAQIHVDDVLEDRISP